MKWLISVLLCLISFNAKATEKDKINCKGSQSASKCFQLGQDYINDPTGDYEQGFDYVAYACKKKNSTACRFNKEKLSEFNLKIAKCNQALNYGACERFIYQCDNYKTSLACGVLGIYWANQNNDSMASEYFEKVCDYGDPNGCKILGNLKQQREQSRAIQKQQNESRELAESQQRNQNLINVLQGVNQVLSH